MSEFLSLELFLDIGGYLFSTWFIWLGFSLGLFFQFLSMGNDYTKNELIGRGIMCLFCGCVILPFAAILGTRGIMWG